MPNQLTFLARTYIAADKFLLQDANGSILKTMEREVDVLHNLGGNICFEALVQAAHLIYSESSEGPSLGRLRHLVTYELGSYSWEVRASREMQATARFGS